MFLSSTQTFDFHLDFDPLRFVYKVYPRWGKWDEKDKTWKDARDICIQLGGDLASIHSQEEFDYLRTRMTKENWSKNNFWIGLNDKSSEGRYVWSDRKPVDFLKWKKGEPNNANNEDCVYFHKGDYWNPAGFVDVSCDAENSYICKIPSKRIFYDLSLLLATLFIQDYNFININATKENCQ